MKRLFLPAAAAFSFFAYSLPSLAQEAEVTVAPAPVAAPPVMPAPVAAPPTAAVVVTEKAPPPAEKEKKKDDEEKDSAHFRFGLGLDANYFVSPGTNGIQGLGIGLQVRLGVQMSQWWAIYYQAHGILGGTLADSGDLLGANVIGTVYNSGMIEATLPVLHIGAGPSADVVGVAGLMTPESTNVFFGIDGRAAIVIGGHGPGRHGGLAINFNVHPTFLTGTVLTTFSAGIGGELY